MPRPIFKRFPTTLLYLCHSRLHFPKYYSPLLDKIFFKRRKNLLKQPGPFIFQPIFLKHEQVVYLRELFPAVDEY